MLPESGEGLLEVGYVVLSLLGLDQHVVDVDLHGSPYLVRKHHVHHSLVG